MTLSLAWVGQGKNGHKHLYMATDSRTRGGSVLDFCPKILPLPRSDCAICFAGDTAATYPLMLQLSSAVAAHLPAKNRTLDIRSLKPHMLRVFTDIVGSVEDAADPIRKYDIQFIFGGYSWMKKDFELWTINYDDKTKAFSARPALNFHSKLSQVAIIGDVANVARKRLSELLRTNDSSRIEDFEFEPFKVLRDMLRTGDVRSTIGGPPQLIRIGEHMNVRSFAIKWNNSITLMGRKIFDYENIDNVTIDPDSFKISSPRSYGHRPT